MRHQAQSFSGEDSHLSLLEPPQAPLSKPLAHTVTGQIPPVAARIQSPHCWQTSAKTPASPVPLPIPPVVYVTL